MGYIFLLFLHSWQFYYWIAFIVNFTWLMGGYFCILINIFEPWTWMYLSYLKTFWFFFWVLLLWSCRWGQHSAQSGANYSPLHQGIVAFNPFWWFFPVSGSFPPIYVLNVLILKKDPLKVSNVFFLSFPLFLPPPPFPALCGDLSCGVNYLALPGLSASILTLSESSRLCLGFTSLHWSWRVSSSEWWFEARS